MSKDTMRHAARMLRKYRTATTAEAGATRAEVYREVGVAHRFVLNEIWKDAAAYDMHVKASLLASDLKDDLLAPPDARMHTGYAVGGEGAGRANPRSAYVFTHVDVSPPQLAELETIFKPLVEESRKERGAQRFDIVQNPARKNHFTVIEGWESMAAHQTHELAAYTHEFRRRLNPLLGALYDQRVYREMK